MALGWEKGVRKVQKMCDVLLEWPLMSQLREDTIAYQLINLINFKFWTI